MFRKHVSSVLGFEDSGGGTLILPMQLPPKFHTIPWARFGPLENGVDHDPVDTRVEDVVDRVECLVPLVGPQGFRVDHPFMRGPPKISSL